jgi:hypothetical protein
MSGPLAGRCGIRSGSSSGNRLCERMPIVLKRACRSRCTVEGLIELGQRRASLRLAQLSRQFEGPLSDIKRAFEQVIGFVVLRPNSCDRAESRSSFLLRRKLFDLLPEARTRIKSFVREERSAQTNNVSNLGTAHFRRAKQERLQKNVSTMAVSNKVKFRSPSACLDIALDRARAACVRPRSELVPT